MDGTLFPDYCLTLLPVGPACYNSTVPYLPVDFPCHLPTYIAFPHYPTPWDACRSPTYLYATPSHTTVPLVAFCYVPLHIPSLPLPLPTEDGWDHPLPNGCIIPVGTIPTLPAHHLPAIPHLPPGPIAAQPYLPCGCWDYTARVACLPCGIPSPSLFCIPGCPLSVSPAPPTFPNLHYPSTTTAPARFPAAPRSRYAGLVRITCLPPQLLHLPPGPGGRRTAPPPQRLQYVYIRTLRLCRTAFVCCVRDTPSWFHYTDLPTRVPGLQGHYLRWDLQFYPAFPPCRTCSSRTVPVYAYLCRYLLPLRGT